MLRTRTALLAGAAAAATAVTGLVGFTGSAGAASQTAAATPSSTVTVVETYAADSLDPDYGYTTQAQEADQMVYLPLLTYAAKQGAAGDRIIPGLATALPKITNGGLTYTLTLRRGVRYSNGTRVHASDVRHAIERSIRLSWGGASFFTGYIAGASAYASGSAKSIRGIVVNNAARRITFHLTQPYGAFENTLAFEAAAPLPASTPMRPLSTTPPVGVGPYRFAKVDGSQGYTLVRNPSFSTLHIAGVPTGSVARIRVVVQANTATAIKDVTSNRLDVLDPYVQPTVRQQQRARAAAPGRFARVPLASTYYFFLNTAIAPFNNLAARKAVNLALDRTKLARLGAGQYAPDGYFLPSTITGHPRAPYPYGHPGRTPSAAQVAKAKALVTAAGLQSTPVTVWSQSNEPRRSLAVYLVQVLDEIGFTAHVKAVSDFTYFQQIGNQANHAQAGFADWSEDFPAPSDFYLLLDGTSIQAVNNENFGLVNDPHVNNQLKTLGAVPSSRLASVRSRWAALDSYVAKKAYVAVIGHGVGWKLASRRMNFAHTVISPAGFLLFSTLRVNA